jgi:hypothetical protein
VVSGYASELPSRFIVPNALAALSAGAFPGGFGQNSSFAGPAPSGFLGNFEGILQIALIILFLLPLPGMVETCGHSERFQKIFTRDLAGANPIGIQASLRTSLAVFVTTKRQLDIGLKDVPMTSCA